MQLHLWSEGGGLAILEISSCTSKAGEIGEIAIT